MRDISQFEVLNIKSNCFDILISSFVSWLKGEFGFLYKKCLGFTYLPGSKRIGESICVQKGDIIEEALSNGVFINFYENITESKLLMLLREFNPLILEIDGYLCSWRNTYQKIHKPYEVLVFEYDARNRQFICMDIFQRNHNLRLSMEFILKNFTRIISVSGDSKKYEKLEAQNYLISVVSNLCPACATSSTQHLYSFTYDLPEVIDLQQEIEGYEEVDIINCPIVWNFKNIAWSFYHFIYLLNFISKVEMKEFIDISKKILNYFELISNLLIYRIIKKQFLFSTNLIKKYLWRSVCEEELLIKKLLMYCNLK